MLLAEKSQRGGGSAGVGSVPVKRMLGNAVQATATAARGADAATAGVPTWQPGQAITAPVVALPSQHGQGSLCISAALAPATMTAGKATHASAASRAIQRSRRVAVLITPPRYAATAALSGVSPVAREHGSVSELILKF